MDLSVFDLLPYVLLAIALSARITLPLPRYRGTGVFLMAFVCVPITALAQAMYPDGGLSVHITVTDPGVPDMMGLVQQVLAIVGTFHSAGLIGALIATVNVLVNLTKLPVFDALVNERPWLRPLLALVFGAVLAGLGAAASGASIPAALFAGLVAGLSSGGLHELFNVFNAPKQTERAIGFVVADALKTGDKPITEKVQALKAHLDTLVAIPDEKTRLKALADYSNANPPAAAKA